VVDAPADRPLRSFVAIEIADPARTAVEDLLARLRRTSDAVAWTMPENLHLTLKFLGSVEPARLTRLADRLAAIAAATPPFTIDVRGCGGFPSLARPRVLWIATLAPEIAPLAAAVDDACAAEGFEREARSFHPHVTLGRVRERGGGARGLLDADRERGFGPSPAADLLLFRSDLGPKGARHTALARLPLGGGRAR
jgi:2'-5' RNA ligase